MKIGFFLENKFYDDIDFSKPELGNPGIRGTQYMIWIIACKLAKFHEVYMFAPCINKMPSYLKNYVCQTDKEAYYKACDLGVEVLILRACNEKEKLYKTLKCNRLKIILWSHNFENYKLLNSVANNKNIKSFVCVGRQQYERLRDHKIFFKSTYIYNALDFSSLKQKRGYNDSKTVTYIGALNNQKGFHILARAWRKIYALVPEAQLFVLGSGNMGNRTVLGKHGLSDIKYEKKFIKYLLDEDGHLLSNVHFMGNLGGNEKEKIMLKTSVGVANPSGKSETFCIVATEFEALGIPVVSKKGYGLLDTVINDETGILVKNEKELVSAIAILLNKTDLNKKMGMNGYNFVRKNFSIETVVQQWLKLLNDVENDKIHNKGNDYNFPLNQGKWLRELNRKIQSFGIKTPSLILFEYIKPLFINIILKLKKRWMD